MEHSIYMVTFWWGLPLLSLLGPGTRIHQSPLPPPVGLFIRPLNCLLNPMRQDCSQVKSNNIIVYIR